MLHYITNTEPVEPMSFSAYCSVFLGIHNIYAGYYGKASTQLSISVGLGWIYWGIVITG
jgi:hypothetical protein